MLQLQTKKDGLLLVSLRGSPSLVIAKITERIVPGSTRFLRKLKKKRRIVEKIRTAKSEFVFGSSLVRKDCAGIE